MTWEWWLVIGIRFLVPLTILRWKLLGSVLAILADNFDVVILDNLGIKDYAFYNPMDKFMDTYFYLIQGYTVLSWKNDFAKKIASGLLAYRLVGTVVYEFVQKRWLLMVFPNVFIYFYMYYLISNKFLKRDPYKVKWELFVGLGVMTLVKLWHEYMLHVVQFPIYDWMKSH